MDRTRNATSQLLQNCRRDHGTTAMRVLGNRWKGMPLAPPRNSPATPNPLVLCGEQGQWGGSGLSGLAQALGLFLMSSTSASTISRTSSCDPEQGVSGKGGVSATLSWRHLLPYGGLHPALPCPPRAPGCLPRQPLSSGLARTGPGASKPTDSTVKRILTSKATRGFQFSFCFALLQSPCRKSCGWRERESRRGRG